MGFEVGEKDKATNAELSPRQAEVIMENYSKMYWLSIANHWKSKNKVGLLTSMQVFIQEIILKKSWILTKKRFTSYPPCNKKWNWGPFTKHKQTLHFWIKLYLLLWESHVLTFADKALWIVFRNCEHTQTSTHTHRHTHSFK